MKNLFVFAVAALALSSCYAVTYDSTLSLTGTVTDQSGHPQSFDLNERAKICVLLTVDTAMEKKSPNGQSGFSKILTYCRALTSDANGKLHANFSPETPERSDFQIGRRRGEIANVKSAKAVIVLANDDRIEGEVVSMRKTSADRYAATAVFVVNKSNYSPDRKVDVNSAQRDYLGAN